jgi:hypothetical protein
MEPVERNLDRSDSLEITRRAVRETVNFSGTINPNDTLGTLGVQAPEIDPLKLVITGSGGVENFVYTLNVNFLVPVKPASTISAVADIVFNRSMPVMTQKRATTVVKESVSATIGDDIPQPDANDTLASLGINTADRLDIFRHAAVEHPFAGVSIFRHVISIDVLGVVTMASTVRQVSTIIRENAQPRF